MSSVLITGGSGFFGRAFVRACLEKGVDRICVFSRDEWKQARMRQLFGNDSRLRWFVGDVRDENRLRRAMHNVSTVIHAAALKRVEVGEYNPDELAKTNIIGSLNVISAAIDAGVRNVVALSSDKAAAPYNAYGASKLLMEKLFLSANNMVGPEGTAFSVTRYGNVANSTGSVLPVWKKAMLRDQEMEMTDPNCTRFWMTVEEAVTLVMHAIGKRTLLVPDLQAYRLGDLAAALGGRIKVIGLRDGEKLHESMIGPDEVRDFVRSGHYWIRSNEAGERRTQPLSSDLVEHLSVDKLKEKIGVL